MTVQNYLFNNHLSEYLRSIGTPEHPELQRIRTETAAHRLGKMAIAPEQAAVMTWLARLTGAQSYLEIGVFTGYSSTAMALAMPEQARITCCDINVSFTDIARQNWQKAGVAHKMELLLQPALLSLNDLIAQNRSYDIALIDADKPPTPHYYERCLKLVRSGGIIAVDNVLLGGRVAQERADNAPEAVGILQAFNAALPHDARIIPLTLPVGDGLTLLMKK